MGGDVVMLRGLKVPRRNIWSPGNGRDYARVGNEVYSINGVDQRDGSTEIMDVRWSVVVEGRAQDGSDRKVLVFRGDRTDREALAHYGFTEPNSLTHEVEVKP